MSVFDDKDLTTWLAAFTNKLDINAARFGNAAEQIRAKRSKIIPSPDKKRQDDEARDKVIALDCASMVCATLSLCLAEANAFLGELKFQEQKNEELINMKGDDQIRLPDDKPN